MAKITGLLVMAFVMIFSVNAYSAETNTISSTVVTDKTPPTASAPGIVVNNSDVCKSAASAAIQTQIFGFASGITITDTNCERLKLARGLYGMGMKVAAVAALCQDPRVFDAMIMAGTPCPYRGKIGKAALDEWEKNPDRQPPGALSLKKNVENSPTSNEESWETD